MTCHHTIFATFAVMLFGARGGYAQDGRHGDVAAANALFLDGRRLSAGGQFAEACARFEASLAILPRLGVRLNLADCNERLGKTATAWKMFGEAAALARRMADRREVLARRRQERLVARVSRLIITLPSSTPSETISVMRDGVRVAPSEYNLGIPVDPGVHTVEAAAPDRTPWSARVVVSGKGEVVAVEIPDLVRRPDLARRPVLTPVAEPVREHVASSGAPAEPTDAPARRHPTPGAWTLAGIGIAGIGAGTALGLSARSLRRQAGSGCDLSNACDEAAYSLIERSRHDGNLSTISFAIGTAALVAGVVLYIRSPRDHQRSIRVVPAITPGAASVTATGAW